MSNKQYSKPQVTELGDAVKVTLGPFLFRRDFLGGRRRNFF